MEKHKVVCGQNIIEYELTRKAVKNINLRIKVDGHIMVSAPRKVPVTYINQFIIDKQKEILKALETYKGRNKETPKYPQDYANGEFIFILGKKFMIKIVQDQVEKVKLTENDFFLYLKDPLDRKRKEKIVINWSREFQEEIYQKIAKDIYPFFQKYHIPYPTIKIRNMKSRWGSCHPQKGIITLSTMLISRPIPFIEYVVLHEFAHFVHPNHSKEFYQLVTTFMPDWKERKKDATY